MSTRFKILLFCLLFAGIAQAQTPIPRGSAAVTVQDANLDVLKHFKIPTVVDTAHGLFGLDSLGLLIFVRSTGAIYKRDTVTGGHKWTLVNSGGGGYDSTIMQTIYRDDTSKINLRAQIAAAGAPQTLSYVQGPVNNTVSISGGNTITLQVATTNLAGLIDTARLRWLDSARLGLLTDTTTYRSTGSSGIPLNYVSQVGRNTTVSIPKIRGVLDAGVTFTGDSAVQVSVQAHDSTTANALQTKYRTDTMRTRINNDIALKMTNPMTAPGQMIYGGASGTPTATATPGHAGMRPTWNGTAVVFTDTAVGGGGAPDSSVFVTSTRLNKNAAGADTLWHVVYGIPQPNGTGVNGTPITWSWLITGGEHAFSPDLDSCLFVSSSGHLQVGFATPMDVAVGGLFGDEQTFPIVWQVIGNNDNFDFGAWLHQSGIGANIVGSGAGGVWSLQGAATVGPYTFTIDTSTQGIVSFDLIDGNNQYLGATTNGATVVYNGSNGYSLKRLFAGLTRNYKYQLLDAAGNPVIGQPAVTDRLGIFLGVSYPVFVDMRQFTSSNQFYFGSGLPNMWFIGMIKLQPDSLKIIRPVSFTATALTATTASITWSAVSNAALGYQLDRSTNPNFSGSVTNLLTGAGTSFSDTGLTTGTIYYYRLRAIRASGQYSGWKLRQITTP